jgi:predicted metal-dependent hydrolase
LHGDERRFVQGLIQIAVGLYHAGRWNAAGARGLFARAVKRLEGFAPEYAGVQVSALLAEVAPWRAAVELSEKLPPGPVLRWDKESFGETIGRG